MKAYNIIPATILCFSVLTARSQGLLFKSEDSLLTQRTSLHVFDTHPPVFHDNFYIEFDLSLWDNENLGYVLDVADKDNSYSLSYLYNNGAGTLNFNIDRKSNKLVIPLSSSLLRKKAWFKVRLDFDLKDDNVAIDVDNTVYLAQHLGFQPDLTANIVFGKNQLYTEVPNMAIRNLTVGDDSRQYFFPLNEWSGTIVHDSTGAPRGTVENPVWLINESYFWKPVYTHDSMAVAGGAWSADTEHPRQKTSFQTSSPWIPQIDVRSDMAIVYGTGDRKGVTFEQRVQSWRDHGYQVAFMTGIAWGSYFDYFLGKWDGQNHLGVGQVTMKGDTIWHGHNMPYVVPVASFLDYMKTAVVKRVIDAGVNRIFLEEPEFWARAGYSKPFKAEWQKFYGFPWRPQDASPENTYLSSKLKYQLYYNAIREVSNYAKEYALRKGRKVKVYIATHSLVNYSSWQIVSPEASLASLPGIDGYIAQVWTGTSREPTYFDGRKKERVFENAFLEYGSMLSMTAPTGRKLFFLTDPIEDWPRDWADYKRNYQATFTAEILYPTVDNYEVMPWPERIYTRPYKLAGSDSAVLIPHYYSTQMQVMINVLNKMPASRNRVSGVGSIGVLMSNSLMFQRFPTHDGYDDPQFSNFYGQTLPLVKRGVPVQTVHMENLGYPATLASVKVLVMSYSNMKPGSPAVHEQIARWVRRGGVLIYCGRDDDPYQSVMDWWDTKGRHYRAPSEHLFGLLGLDPHAGTGRYPVGTGAVYVIRQDPKEFVLQHDGDGAYLDVIKKAFETDARAGALILKNSFYLERGPYDIISVLDENPDAAPYVVKGPVIDLFDPSLPVLDAKTVAPGEQALLYDLARVADKTRPSVLASAARIYSEMTAGRTFSFVAKSPANTVNSMRVLLPAAPSAVSVTDSQGATVSDVQSSWDEASHTEFLGFANSPDGVKVQVTLP